MNDNNIVRSDSMVGQVAVITHVIQIFKLNVF